jgi:hypothetical protein
MFMESPAMHFFSHYVMELLSSLFGDAMAFDAESPSQRKPLFIIRRISRRNGHNPAAAPTDTDVARTMPRFHTELWPMLSDHEWVEWDDVMVLAVRGLAEPLEQPEADFMRQPSLICFRRLHVFQDHAMLSPTALYEQDMARIGQLALRWRKYREALWSHLRVSIPGAVADPKRVLLLRRQGSRRLLNHDQIVGMLQAHGFQVSSILPDTRSVSAVAAAVVQASLLIGINSGTYNAVFLPARCGVLELAPHGSGSYLDHNWANGPPTWQVGFERLGLHLCSYACPHLFTESLHRIISSGGAAAATSPISPIVVSPRTILRLLSELVELLEQARESESEVGSIRVQACFSWETGHTQSWTSWTDLDGVADTSVT